MQKTKIPYCDFTSNPIRFRRKDNGKMGWACIRHSAQCDHCYAEVLNRRFGTGLPHDAESMKLVEPVLMDRELDQLAKARGRVFVEDMSDLFGPFVPEEMRHKVLYTLENNKVATFLLLTKWPAIMQKCLDHRWNVCGKWSKPPSNIWVGVTYTKDDDVMRLLNTPANVRWISVEPMLGPIDLKLLQRVRDDDYRLTRNRLSWYVFGAESGSHRRPCDLAWVRDGVRQCQEAGVPVFVKQLDIGGKLVDDPMLFPPDLQVRQWPS